MGQYFVLADHTRKEYINPHSVGDMYKQAEIVLGTGNLNKLALFLMTDGRVDGGAIRGRWGGDEVTLVGDYRESAVSDGVPKSRYPSWAKIHETYRDVSREAVEEFNAWAEAMGCPDHAIPYRPDRDADLRADRGQEYYPVGRTYWLIYPAKGDPKLKPGLGTKPPTGGRMAFLHRVEPQPAGTPLPPPEPERRQGGAVMRPDMVLTVG
jgi:hypothetical protein